MSAHDGASESTVSCWVGVDVSKAYFDAAIARTDQHFPSTPVKALPCERFERTPAGVKAFVEWLDKCKPRLGEDARVVMEATGNYSIELAAWMLKRRVALQPAIVNPGKVKSFLDSLGQRNKTDNLAARGLAFFGVERAPSPHELPTPERQELRELSRCRTALVAQRTALKNRRQEGSHTKLVKKLLKRQLRELERDIQELEAAMRQLIREHEPFHRDFKLLTSIPGVGFVTATVILAELGDLRRFQRARQVTALAGLNPRIVESGTSVRGQTRMCKWGNRHVRNALYMSAMASLRSSKPNEFKTTYGNLCDRGKTGKASLGAVMRKQLTVMRAMLINEQPYDPMWKTRGKPWGKVTPNEPNSP